MSSNGIYRLINAQGMAVHVSAFGATLTGIYVPDREGQLVNVVLSYPDLEAYKQDNYYIGATLGRYANRIKGGRLSFLNQNMQLSVNEVDKGNHLHGGFHGFNKKTWEVINYTEKSIELHYLSKDGEEGFSGDLSVTAIFKVTEQNELWVDFQAETSRITVVNLSNHTYFNLSGRGHVGEHFLQVFADLYTPADNCYIPTGEIALVGDTCFDLRKGVRIGEVMEELDTLNYVFSDRGELQQMARLSDPLVGIQLNVSSTHPGLQLYFGNYLSDPFSRYQGVCLEPQHFPDSPNHVNFPSTLLRPGESYEQQICYQFTNF